MPSLDTFLELLGDEPAAVADVSVLRASRRAMATTFEVMLPFGSPLNQPAAEAALDLVDELEDQLTVYRDHSEVCRLNAVAADRPVEIERRLFDLIEFAAHITRQTHGAFDIATGALIKAWGFYKREGRVPTPIERAQAMAQTGIRFVALDCDRRSVRYLRRGLEINFGGIGKGYALDRAAELLMTSSEPEAAEAEAKRGAAAEGERPRRGSSLRFGLRDFGRRGFGIASALMHGGASSVRAIGTLPGHDRGWPIAIKHPWEPERRLGTVYLNNAGLGTSAATFQHFAYNGRTLGHLLDPRTGWPAESVQQVTAIAPTAVEADALSTAFFVLGVEATARFCQTRPDVGVVMLPAGQDRPITFNLDGRSLSLSQS